MGKETDKKTAPVSVNFVAQGSSYLASYRIRNKVPVELMNMGTKGKIEAKISKKFDEDANVNVFSKHFERDYNMEVLENLDEDAVTIFDVCDDHFDNEELGDYYKFMCDNVSLVTCNTKNMSKRIKEVTGLTSLVIPDPITFPYHEPKEPDNSRMLQVLWFGHSSNLAPLYDILDYIPHRVTVISDSLIQRPVHPNVDFVRWYPNLVESTIQNYDVVIIPTDTDSKKVSCKSPNRAVDALNAGKFVVTNNKDIYGDLKGSVAFYDDPEEIESIIESYLKEYNPKPILKGQERIQELYGNDVVLGKWLEALKEVKVIKGVKSSTTKTPTKKDVKEDNDTTTTPPISTSEG